MSNRLPSSFNAGQSSSPLSLSGRLAGKPRVSRKDRIVQSTDYDALSSKYSAFKKGYLEDPYLESIVSSVLHHSTSREPVTTSFAPKLPVINIGSSVRHFAITSLVDLFLESTGSCQIISLGAGSDTRPFSLLSKYNRGPENTPKILYHELDFEVSTIKKVHTILETPLLSNLIYGDHPPAPTLTEKQPHEIHTTDYHLHACDLRTLKGGTGLLEGMDPNLPTLVISECCLCYLQPEESDHVFAWLVEHFQNGLGVLLYEPIGGGDSFGEVMIENLATRGISLPTLKKYPTLQSEVSRLTERGLTSGGGLVKACDMMYIYENWISSEEHARLSKLEFLDEIEELSLLLKHYCVAWTVTNGNPVWVEAFTALPSQVNN